MKYKLETKEYSATEERIFTWLYSYNGYIDAAEKNLSNDSKAKFLKLEKKKYILDEESNRRVNPKIMKPLDTENAKKMIIVRHYNIKNDWNEFLDIWEQIVPVRENMDFLVCLL